MLKWHAAGFDYGVAPFASLCGRSRQVTEQPLASPLPRAWQQAQGGGRIIGDMLWRAGSHVSHARLKLMPALASSTWPRVTQ